MSDALYNTTVSVAQNVQISALIWEPRHTQPGSLSI